jgi:hypothetical protein
MPSTPPPPESAIPAIIWQHAEEVLSAEDEAARLAAGPLRNQLDQILQTFRLRWVREYGTFRSQQSGRDFIGFMADLSAALSAVHVDPAPALIAAAGEAQALGVRQAFIEAGLDPVERAVVLDLALHDYANGIAEKASELVDRAARMAATVRKGSFTAVTRTVSVAEQGANQIDRAARTITNEQVNDGIGDVAEELGARELWVAERDACVHCLALSGHLSDPETGLFDASLTFGGKPITWLPGATEQPGGAWSGGELDGPPRHPNCRCRKSPWFGHDTAGAESITHDWAGAIAEARANGDQVAEDAAHRAAAAARRSAATDLPAALRREAERSVLNGWALPSEPNSTRTKAAEQLLSKVAGRGGFAPSGWKVPASVRKGAEKDLKKGTFHTRSFPGP